MIGFFQQLTTVAIYKRNQGRITRQVTFAAMAITMGMGFWQVSQIMIQSNSMMLRFGLPGVLLMLGLWVAYRVVNIPGVADFLIAVEAEMNKVSWPSRGELFRASVVVLITIFALATVLLLFDTFWTVFFEFLGVFERA